MIIRLLDQTYISTRTAFSRQKARKLLQLISYAIFLSRIHTVSHAESSLSDDGDDDDDGGCAATDNPFPSLI